jgi:hypothetical protein
MSRWKLIDHWDRDLTGLSEGQLSERLELAQRREWSSQRKGMGRNPKATRDWRGRREAAGAELRRRAAKP